MNIRRCGLRQGESRSFLRESEDLRNLRILEEIEKDSHVSQRHLAISLGVALGVANACVHALARKGMLKIRGSNNRGVTYHLTKKGLAFKSGLAIEWTMNTLEFYRAARQDISDRLSAVADAGYRRVVLFGVDEQVEIACLVARSVGLEVVAVAREGESYLGDRVVDAPVVVWDELPDSEVDAVVHLGPADRDATSAAARTFMGRGLSLPFLDLAGGVTVVDDWLSSPSPGNQT